MILLLTSCSQGEECAGALRRAMGERALVIRSLRPKAYAQSALDGNISTVVIDQALLESEPQQVEQFLNNLETAVPVFVNLATQSTEHVVRELRLRLRQHQKERVLATKAAKRILHGELKGVLTGILIASQLSLKAATLEAAQAKMKSVHEFALQLRTRLEAD